MILNKHELGDYQTPSYFCDSIVDLCINKYDIKPKTIIEPTMGVGNFLLTCSKKMSTANLYGIELNQSYINEFRATKIDAQLFNANIFDFNFDIVKKNINVNEEILFIGNPPWVTNSDLSSIGSFNLPIKTNFKKNKGFDALTGKSNFDISEYILLKLLGDFSEYNSAYFAFLCKSVVPRNIVRDLEKYSFQLDFADLYYFDSLPIFGVACDSVLFVCKISKTNNLRRANCFDFDDPYSLKFQFGYMNDFFIANMSTYNSELDGKCEIPWRQGIKHDCSKVMEFTKISSDKWINGYKEDVSNLIGSDFVFPLIKSSGFKSSIVNAFNKAVIVTQSFIGDSTSRLNKDPLLYRYLVEHYSDFEKRKSSIYKKADKFAIFGVGEYSFAKYKIGISGFYKEPKFSFLTSHKPVMLDDTSYFLNFDNEIDSKIAFSMLDNSDIYAFLKSVAFLDSKRPFTKEILQRLSFVKIRNYLGDSVIIKRAYEIFGIKITSFEISSFINDLKNGDKRNV